MRSNRYVTRAASLAENCFSRLAYDTRRLSDTCYGIADALGNKPYVYDSDSEFMRGIFKSLGGRDPFAEFLKIINAK